MKKTTTILLYVLLGLILLITTGCGDASFEAVNTEPQACTIKADQIVCPDGTSAPLPRDGVDGVDGLPGVDGVNAVIYSQTVVPKNKCVKVADRLYIENVRSGTVFDVYYNDECKDHKGEYCDNVIPSFGVSGSLGPLEPGSGTVCWADTRQISGSVLPGGDLLIRVLEF